MNSHCFKLNFNDDILLYITYWEILTKKLCCKFWYANEFWPVRVVNYGFHVWKNDTSNQKPQGCVSFAPKFPPFLAACWAPLRTHSRRKVFLKEFFLVKKVKNISEMEWNSFLCFTVDKENCGEPVKQQRKRKNRTRRNLMLCFLSEILCLPFISLSWYWNRPFYLISLIFNCTFRTNS